MRATFDLHWWQPSFTSVIFLMGVEHERIRRKAASVDIIVTGEPQAFKGWPRTAREVNACLANIFHPMARMLPSVSGVEQRKNVEPDSFRLRSKFDAMPFMEAYAAGIRPLRAPRDYGARRPRLVTITLRECGEINGHWPQRDSNLKEWIEAANEIAQTHEVIIVRDTAKAFEPIKGHETHPLASVNLDARARLYSKAACNLFVNNGPAWFALALDAPAVIFKLTHNEAGKTHAAAAMARFGIVRGEQIAGAPLHQRLSWRKEKAKHIIDATHRFLEERT